MLYGKSGGAAATGAAFVPGSVIPTAPQFDIARTNLILQSNVFSAAPWAATAGVPVVTLATTASPDGTVDAVTINDNQVAVIAEQAQTVVIANNGQTYAASIYMCATGTSIRARFGLRLTGGTALESFLEFNPQSGLIISQQGGSLDNLTINGVAWYRIKLILANNTSGNVNAQTYIQPASGVAGSVGTVIVFGSQLEAILAAGAPTAYIPTAAAAVTIIADAIQQQNLTARYTQSLFLASANYTVPAWWRAGNSLYVSGRGGGGGGGGATLGASTGATGGGEGASAIRVPIAVNPGQVIAVTIPAAAAGGVGLANGATGGNVTFGALLTINGGGAGQQAANAYVAGALGGAATVAGTFAGQPSDNMSLPVIVSTNGGTMGGGVGGLGGMPGGNNGVSALANSGGGGGGASDGATRNGGNGGTGWLMVETA